MGFFELLAAAMPWETVEAEAPEKPEKDEESEESGGKEDSEDGEEDSKEDEPEEDEEEEEEELVDPKDTLEEECKESKQCAPVKHHFDECVERVTAAEEEGNSADKKHPNEDCVEEFFHLAHCASQCAAPKLWAQLK